MCWVRIDSWRCAATDAICVLGRLPERVSIAGYLVTPFAGRLDEPRPYHPEVAEVVDVFEVPLAAFMEEHRWTFRPTTLARSTVLEIPYFDADASQELHVSIVPRGGNLGAGANFVLQVAVE